MKLYKAFFTVGGATLLSRVLGFVREIMIAALVGTGPVADAFYAAFRFPNLFRRLFAEGAFNTAFIPLFSKSLEEDGEAAARLFANSVLSVLVATLIILTVLSEIFMPFLVAWIIAPRFADPVKIDLVILFSRIMFPYLAAMSLVAAFAGILNSFRKYALAAFAPNILNVVMIGVLSYCLIAETGNSAASGVLMSVGVMSAGVLQFLLLLYGLKRQGFQLRLYVPRLTPGVKRFLILAIPAAMTGGITQINLIVGQIIASAEAGAIATLNFADRIYQLPLGVVGIAIGVVLLPELSRSLKSGTADEIRDLQSHSIEFSLFLTLPATLALAIIPLEIVTVLFERGAFGPEDSNNTALALTAFAFGLPSFVLIKVLSPGFFAREDMRTPMWFAGLNAFVNMVLSLVLFPIYGFVGIAIATSVGGWVNVIALYFGLRHKGYWVWSGATLMRILKIMLASGLMGLALYFSARDLLVISRQDGLVQNVIELSLLIAIGAASYFAVALLFKVYRPSALKGFLKRR